MSKCIGLTLALNRKCANDDLLCSVRAIEHFQSRRRSEVKVNRCIFYICCDFGKVILKR